MSCDHWLVSRKNVLTSFTTMMRVCSGNTAVSAARTRSHSARCVKRAWRPSCAFVQPRRKRRTTTASLAMTATAAVVASSA